MLPSTDLILLAATALYVGLILLLGYVVVSATLPGRHHWALLFGLTFAAGAGLLPIVLMVVSVVGFKPNRSFLFLLAAVLVVAVNWLRTRHRLAVASVPTPLKFNDPWSILGLLAAATIVLSATNVLYRSSWPGPGDIDVLAIWLFRAKWVYFSPLRPLPIAFTDPNLSYAHQDYPLGPPFLAAGAYTAVGGVVESAAKLLLGPIYLSVAAVAYGFLRSHLRRAVALAVTAVFVAAPTLAHNAGVYVAETPLVLMLLCSLAALVIYTDTQAPGSVYLCVLFAAAAAFTKNEGLALLPVLPAMAIWLSKNRAAVFKCVALGLLTNLPWLVLRHFLPHTHEDYGSKLSHPAYVFSHRNRLPAILVHLLFTLFNATQLGLIWYVLPVTAAVGYRNFGRPIVRALWSFLAIQLTLYTLTFVVTPWDLNTLLGMITSKLLVQATPAAVMLIGLHCRSESSVASTTAQYDVPLRM